MVGGSGRPAASFATLPRVRHRYPFEALQWLRKKRVDREAVAASERAARTERARAEELRAQAAREAAQHELASVARGELERLDEGGVRAGELAQVGAWERGARSEIANRAAHEARATAAHRTEIAAELVARRALAVASSKADVIDAHRAEWQAERVAAEERTAEEMAVEQWTAKRFPRRD